jgi:hypothetical protein
VIGNLMKPQARTAVQIPGRASVRNRIARGLAIRLRLCLPFHCCLDDLILHQADSIISLGILPMMVLKCIVAMTEEILLAE